MNTHVHIGLDVLVAEGCARLKGQRVGLLCHAASIDSQLRHIVQSFHALDVNVVRCFGPEHGIWADAQDMIPVGEQAREPITGTPVRSLYGNEEASLFPKADDLKDLDVLVVDLQDVGARYYTYIYTAAMAAKIAAQVGVKVMILDRPNPIGGAVVEGRMTGTDYLSFVGYWPLPTRHGLTIGEVVSLLNEREGFGADIEVVEMVGWRRSMYFDETGIPWVQPSPNMPTLDSAIVYPGMCLIEGTEMSEGRGTTRPFELVGADYVDPFALADELNSLALSGIAFRPVFYRPTFHKYGGLSIGGTALHVTDRHALDSLRMGLHYLGAVRRLFGDAMAWRADAYEFVRDRLAIDLLFGGTDARILLDQGASAAALDELWHSWQAEARAFEEARTPFLRYS